MDGRNLTDPHETGLYHETGVSHETGLCHETGVYRVAGPDPGAPGGRDEVLARYAISADIPLADAAEALAIEQSLGTRSASAEVVAAHGARVVSVIDAGSDRAATLASGTPAGNAARHSGYVEIAFPAANLGSLPTLVVAVAGEALETKTFKELRLLALGLPGSLLGDYGGPAFGVSGVRAALGVRGRPLVVAILKPSVGLSPTEAADLAARMARAGADVIKDDELNSSITGCDMAERARAVSDALAWVESETMSPKAYAVNITGPLERLVDIAENLNGLGNVWPMLCDQALGYDAVRMVSRWSARPILCHRASGAFRGGPFGVEPSVVAGLTRLAGGDLVHCGGVGGKLFDSKANALASVGSCSTDLGEIAGSVAMIGGGYWAGSIGAVRRAMPDDNFAYVLGSGVTDHPDGPTAGVRSVMIALEAEIEGRSFGEVADIPEVERATMAFGSPWEDDDLRD